MNCNKISKILKDNGFNYRIEDFTQCEHFESKHNYFLKINGLEFLVNNIDLEEFCKTILLYFDNSLRAIITTTNIDRFEVRKSYGIY